MSMSFVRCGCMLLFTTPRAVVLSVCMGVWGCLWPISASVVLCGIASRALMYNAPNSASVEEDMTALMSWARLSTALLLAGSSQSDERKKCPPVRLCALGLLSYDASLCTTVKLPR